MNSQELKKSEMQEYELITFQTTGHDITLRHEPLPEYIEDYGPYSELQKHLKWDQWLWTFPSLSDYQNPYFRSDYLKNNTSTLWRLYVPAKKIKWCGLLRQCDNETPAKEWFFDDPDTCRKNGDVPQGLIKMPIKPEWVVKRGGAISSDEAAVIESRPFLYERW